MRIFISTNTGTKTESAQQIEFRRQLDAIPSWSPRAQKIEDRLQETTRALGARDEQLFALRGDFDARRTFRRLDNRDLVRLRIFVGSSNPLKLRNEC